jgi:hypothetical protein
VSASAIEQDTSVSPPAARRRFEIGEGTWTFSAVGTTAGKPVEGSSQGMLYRVP